MMKTRLIMWFMAAVFLALTIHANLLPNPGFEEGDLSGWITAGGSFDVVASPVHSGSFACSNYNRTATWNAIRGDLSSIIAKDATCRISIWARVNEGGPYTARLQTKVVASESGTVYEVVATEELTTEWKLLQGYTTLTYSGTLSEATFYVNSVPIGVDVLVDDASVVPLAPVLWSDAFISSNTVSAAWISARVSAELTEAVLVWDTQDHIPGTVSDWPNRVSLGPQVAGEVTGQMTGLAAGTEYTWRIYGTNSLAGGWSDASTFISLPKVVGSLVSKDSIVGRRQESAPALDYYPDAADNLCGVTGSGASLTRHDRNVVLGFSLPTLPPGASVVSARLNFEITSVRDQGNQNPALNVYLLNTGSPDGSGTNFFFHGPSDPNENTELVGETYIAAGTSDVNFADDEQDQVYEVTGEALELLKSFYGGDNVPEQSEAFFRFNMDVIMLPLDTGNPYQRYRIDLADDEASLLIYHTPIPVGTTLIIH
jgi:hypothetical protein